MAILADSTAAATPYLIALVGSGGLVGAIVGFFKLRGDRDSQAVSQAQGAVETMADVQTALEKALARANDRADYYRRRCEEINDELEEVKRRWGPFPVDEDDEPPNLAR